MSDDLVKRLRNRGVCSPAHNSCRNDFICEQAADRIEELEAENAILKTEVEKLKGDLRDMALDYLAAEGQAYDAYKAQEDLEAKLAKAVEALEEAIYLLDPEEEDIAKETGIYRVVTTCKELKGEDQ